jgi:hypothetical protein
MLSSYGRRPANPPVPAGNGDGQYVGSEHVDVFVENVL